jgi:hypothetical protein
LRVTKRTGILCHTNNIAEEFLQVATQTPNQYKSLHQKASQHPFVNWVCINGLPEIFTDINPPAFEFYQMRFYQQNLLPLEMHLREGSM